MSKLITSSNQPEGWLTPVAARRVAARYLGLDEDRAGEALLHLVREGLIRAAVLDVSFVRPSGTSAINASSPLLIPPSYWPHRKEAGDFWAGSAVFDVPDPTRGSRQEYSFFGIVLDPADVHRQFPITLEKSEGGEMPAHMDRDDTIGAPVHRDFSMDWDVFISHASEDKEDLVRPLAQRLEQKDLKVWFDEFTLTVGDSLRRSIDNGLAKSRFGIVVVSPDFLRKEWPQKELDGLAAREVGEIKVILPVWHRIGAADIRRHSPMLADRLAASSSSGLDHVTEQLLKAMGRSPELPRQQHAVTSPSLATPFQAVPARHSELVAYAADLHRQHVADLAAGKGPVDILDGGALVMHVVPLGAIGDTATIAFEAIAQDPHKFEPMSSRVEDFKITYDGMLVGSNAKGLSQAQRAYAFVFRSGTVEAVESSLGRGPGNLYLQLPALQASIIKYACMYAQSLANVSIGPPFAVCFSLIRVKGMKLLQDFISGNALEDLSSGDLDRDVFDFGHTIFRTLPQDYNEAAKALRPILMHLANAAGLYASPYFNADGSYELASKL